MIGFCVSYSKCITRSFWGIVEFLWRYSFLLYHADDSEHLPLGLFRATLHSERGTTQVHAQRASKTLHGGVHLRDSCGSTYPQKIEPSGNRSGKAVRESLDSSRSTRFTEELGSDL